MDGSGARRGRALGPIGKKGTFAVASAVALAVASSVVSFVDANAAVSIYGRALSDEPVEYLQDEETLAPQAALNSLSAGSQDSGLALSKIDFRRF